MPDQSVTAAPSNNYLSIKVAAIYMVFSLLWIYFSDRILDNLVQDPELILQLQTYKGWAFVCISGLLIYSLTHLGMRQKHDIQHQLDQKSEQQQQVLNTLSHSIIQYSLDGQISYLNPAAMSLYGSQNDHPDHKLPTLHLTDICHLEEDVHRLTSSLFNLAKDGQISGQLRLSQRSLNDHLFTASFDWTVQKDAQGLITGFIAAVTDISEQQRHQQQLDQAALVFDVADEGYMITDAQGTILNVNPSFSRITGYSAEQIIGQSPSLLSSGKHEEAFYEALWDQLVRTGHWQGEFVNKNAAGDEQHIWQKIYALKDSQGIVQKYIAILYEINNLKQTGIDDLTQLPNLPQLRDRLSALIPEAEKRREHFCIAYIDLDNFQGINDSFGHQTGDQLVQEVAQRLAELCGPEDIIARQGGDEFIILGRDMTPIQGNVEFADKLLASFTDPFELQGQKLFITASIGLCCYPEDGENTSTLLRNADTALFRAKDTGKNNYQFYTTQLTSNAVQKMEVEIDLRRAVTESPQEFVVFYQPQINLETGMIASAEALVRWQHPDGKRIGPDQFIPAAESTGLIIPLGKQILQQACTDFLAWQAAGLPLDRVCVNVSMIQLLRSNLRDDVLEVLQTTGLAAHHLELEVTETALMKENEQVAEILSQLQSLGIAIAIDDFGTGYSSLGRLQSLPVDRLKIDRSFMPESADDHHDHALITSVLSLAKNLDLEVVAEGVETEYQAELLIKNRCQLAQGYLYSPPVSQVEFIRWASMYSQVMSA